FFKKMIHLRKIGIRILENASRVIFLSSAYQNEVIEKMIPERLREKIRNQSVVIPNGIDNFWFENIGSPKTIEGKKEIRLLYVGEISKNKNVQATIRAMEQLDNIESALSYTLTAVGKIKDRNLYAHLIASSHFSYIEPQKKEKLIRIYRDHDIFVMPSIHETFGLVYAEAMSQGLPVVYTRGQGFDGQFDDGDVGYAVDCFNEEEIGNSIRKVINKYTGISSHCIFNIERFSWECISKNYANLYNGVIKEKC
ncbi:glycosyltransferase family 4 protein, partial [bacterium]|nr:glycosyltransferase family 4 protein [candidate division CSSED10-310 bacterium]